jgi:serine/threonine-protein kinase
MAPEQFRGEPVDARADIWAAGVVLYQLLTGEKPFDGGFNAVMHKALNTEPPPPSTLSVTVPRAFDAVVARAMAKRPEDRFPTATAFAEAIRAAASAPAATAAVAEAGAGTTTAFSGANAAGSQGEPTAGLGEVPVPFADADATVVAGRSPPERDAAGPAPAAERARQDEAARQAHAAAEAAAARAREEQERLAREAAARGEELARERQAAEAEARAAADRERLARDQAERDRLARERAAAEEAARAAAERQRQAAAAEAERQHLAELERQRQAELERQHLAELERQRQAELERQRLALLQRPDFRAAASSALDAAPCSLLAAAADDNGLTLAGVLRRGGERAIRRVLEERGVPLERVQLRLQAFDGPYCATLDALRAVLSGPESAPLVSLVGRAPLVKGQLLRFDVALPDWPSQLYVAYVMNSGEVAHLVPSNPQPAGARIRLGEPRAGFPGWEVDEPFGTDLMLVIASERPLFPANRPQVEPLDSYVAALSAALRTAQREGWRVAVRPVVVETVPR